MFNSLKPVMETKNNIFDSEINEREDEIRELDEFVEKGLRPSFEEIQISIIENEIEALEDLVDAVKNCKDDAERTTILSFANRDKNLENMLQLTTEDLLNLDSDIFETKINELINKIEGDDYNYEEKIYGSGSSEINDFSMEGNEEETNELVTFINKKYKNRFMAIEEVSLEDPVAKAILASISGAALGFFVGVLGFIAMPFVMKYLMTRRKRLMKKIKKLEDMKKGMTISFFNGKANITPYKSLEAELNLISSLDKLGQVTFSSSNFPKNDEEFKKHVSKANDAIRPFRQIFGLEIISTKSRFKIKQEQGKLNKNHMKRIANVRDLGYDSGSFDNIKNKTIKLSDSLVSVTEKHQDKAYQIIRKVVKDNKDSFLTTGKKERKQELTYLKNTVRFNNRIYTACARLLVYHTLSKSVSTLSKLIYNSYK